MADKKFTTALLITGDGSGAQKAIKLTAEQLEDLQKKTKETNVGFKEWEAGIGKAAMAATKWAAGATLAAGAVAASMVKSAIDSAEATGILAGKLGITTEALSKLQYAAKLSDVSQASLETGMKKLARTLTDAASGSAAATKAFDALGLSAEEIINLPADEQLGRIADALNAVENASQRAALAQKIFGRGGVDMLPLLAEGQKGIAALSAEAERMGVVISEDMAKKSQQFNDSVDRLKAAVSGIGLEMAAFVVGPLADFSEGLLAAFKGPALGDLDRIADKLKGLRNQLDGMVAGRMGGTKQADELRAQIKALEELQKASLNVAFANVESGNSAKVLAKENRDLDTVNKALSTSTDKLTTSTKALTAAEKERREDEMMSIFAKAESDKGLYETTKAIESQTTAIIVQKAEADPWAAAMTGAVERIDAAFADAWLEVGDGFDGLLDGMKGALEQWLAEMAHLLITKPLIANISAGFSGGATGGAGGVGGLFSAAKTGYSWLTGAGGTGVGIGTSLGNVYGGLEDALGMLGIKTPGESFRYAGATGLESLGRVGLNIGAGMAGSYLTSSLYGGRESTGYGSMAGGFVGSAFGPMGTFVGAAVGEAIDRALGGSDFTGKRVKLGIGTGSMVNGGDWENSRTLSSGLRVGNLTRRAGDAGLSDEQINTYLSAFDTLDATLTGIARSSGANVDFSKIALAGMPQSYDGGTSGQAFFGSLAKGELRDTLTKAPDEFVRQWLVAIDAELSDRVRGIMGDTAGKTAEQLVGLFGFAADIDRLLSIDVLKDTAAAAESATRSIYTLCGEATEQVVTLAQSFDGTADSMSTLTDALGVQKTMAMQLAQQYAALSDSVNATFGDAITSITESLMTEEQLYASRREQIASLTDQLATTMDPAKIASLTAQIDTLAKGAWSLLDDGQQQSLGAEFVAFLEQARGLAQGQISAGQASLGSREAGLTGAVDLEVMNSAANVQATAANTMQQAVNQFSAWVANLPANIQIRLDTAEVNA